MTKFPITDLFILPTTSTPVNFIEAVIHPMVAYAGTDPSLVAEYVVVEFGQPSFIFLFALVRHSITPPVMTL